MHNYIYVYDKSQVCANRCTHAFMIYSQDVTSSMIYSQNVTSEYLQVDGLLILMYSNCFGLSCLLNNEKECYSWTPRRQTKWLLLF